MSRRPRVLLAAPWLDFAAGTGPTGSTLAIAAALAARAEVTVAFRRLGGATSPGPFALEAIEPAAAGREPEPDGFAVRGADPLAKGAYVLALRRYARRARARFDVALEKGSRFSGILGAALGALGGPWVALECFRPLPARGAGLARRAVSASVERVVRRLLATADAVIAETRAMADLLERGGYASADAIRIVGVGVDRARFRPLEREAARRALGLDPTATLLVYVGALDLYHDLEPAIEALARPAARGRAELHVVGEGLGRARASATAAALDAEVRFHGRVAPERVPLWIAAADLCLAPYASEPFPDGTITFSTLKVREYLACGRPVATVPAEATRELVREGETGFIVENRAAAWEALLAGLPPRARLDAMGAAAARTPLPSWDDTAGRYLDICEEAIARRAAPAGASARRAP